MLLDILLQQIILAHYGKANDVKDADKITLKRKQYNQK